MRTHQLSLGRRVRTWLRNGIHWSGMAENKAVLLLSLESIENVVSGISSGTSDRCTVQSRPRPKVQKAQPPSRQGRRRKKEILPSSINFTATMWACYARVGSCYNAEERKYAEGFPLEKATTKRTVQKTLQAKKSMSTVVL